MMKKVGSALGVLAFGFVMAFALSGWVKGHVFGLMWQTFGNDTFSCGGSQVVSISGKTFEIDGTAISAGGDCRITLTDCHLKGKKTVTTGGSAVLVIEGGTIEGSEIAVSSAGGGLEVRNATLKGGATGLKYYGSRSQPATVTGATIEGSTAVLATHGGKITFADSSITGTPVAVKASHNASVDLGNSKVTGGINKGHGATVVP